MWLQLSSQCLEKTIARSDQEMAMHRQGSTEILIYKNKQNPPTSKGPPWQISDEAFRQRLVHT
jgi:hypothetical protein